MDILTETALKQIKFKQWYMENYPGDELGAQMDNNATFYDLFETLDQYKNIHEKFQIEGAILRERLFEKLAEILDCDYDDVYYQWRDCNNY